MNELYPPESQRMDFLGHLAELRRRILICLVFFAVMSGALFSHGYRLLDFLKQPAHGIIKDFIFLSPTEAFAAYFKVVLLAALVLSFPVLVYQVWAFLSPALSAKARQAVMVWISLSLVCFYGGISFAYLLLLPVSINFLLSFGAGIARPAISISEYISFVSALVLIGGCIFQIPVISGLLTEIGLLDHRKLAQGRRYAILLILILAAVVSPTQDVFNLMLFALPMIVLYEVGIFFSWLAGRRKGGCNEPG